MFLLINMQITWLVLINIVFLIAAILVIRYFFQKRLEKFQEYERNKLLNERNELIKKVIRELKQPTLLLFNENKEVIYNESFKKIIKDKEILEYLKNSDYLQKFMQQEYQERNMEITLDNKKFHVDLIKITHEKFQGNLVIYTDINDIREIYERQENFINDIKHELKTPITAVMGLSDLLAHNRVSDELDKKKILKTIKNETQRLDGLINSLTSTIESEIMMQKVNLNELFEELKIIYNDDNNNIKLIFANYVEEGFMGDYEIIKQILINLVNNSLKFTDDGYVKVSAFIENDKVKIAVVDTGIGISKKEITNIFERFYRIDKSRNRHTGGYGLGLSIVKALLAKINGEITVESKELEGSTFTISIPYIK